MKLTFLGTGTSMGVPVAGGYGSERLSSDPRNTRTRCSVWIQTDETSVLIDAGPEFRIQSIRAKIRNIDHVLLTHEHMDHVAGLDDLRAYNYVQKGPIPVYSSKRCLDSVRKRFDYMFGEKKYPGSTSLELKEISQSIVLNDIKVTPLEVLHGSLEILGFRINDLCYLTDVKSIPEETKELIKGSKVMVLSGLRWGPEHPTHLTIPEAAAIAQELDIQQTYLIHMNSEVEHSEVNKKLPPNVRLAYDEQVVLID
jgi:phosphoribosyl 1,2-cyclic phosphate phosphodiesterase